MNKCLMPTPKCVLKKSDETDICPAQKKRWWQSILGNLLGFEGKFGRFLLEKIV